MSVSPPSNIQLAAGFGHTMVLNVNTQEIFVWGLNDFGQLGIGTQDPKIQQSPLKLPHKFDKRIVSIHCGYNHSAATNEDGEVYMWGYNRYGQLGLGKDIHDGIKDREKNPNLKVILTPQKINNFNVIKLSLGHFHCMAIGKDGLLYGWGNNLLGQLGLGHNDNVCEPTKILLLEHVLEEIGININKDKPRIEKGPLQVSDVECGDYHTIAVAKEKKRTLYVMGYNRTNQLGLGDKYPRNRFCPAELVIPTKLEEDIVQIACGADHSYAITKNEKNTKTYWGWGSNYYCQFGDGSCSYNVEKPKKNTYIEENYIPLEYVKCSGWNTIGKVEDGKVEDDDVKFYVWGYNGYGQLGKELSEYYQAMPGSGDKKVHAAKTPIKFKLPNDEPIQTICVGYYHMLALTTEGKLYAWGNHEFGQLGIGPQKEFNEPNSTPDLALPFYCYLTEPQEIVNWHKAEVFRPEEVKADDKGKEREV